MTQVTKWDIDPRAVLRMDRISKQHNAPITIPETARLNFELWRVQHRHIGGQKDGETSALCVVRTIARKHGLNIAAEMERLQW